MNVESSKDAMGYLDYFETTALVTCVAPDFVAQVVNRTDEGYIRGSSGVSCEARLEILCTIS